MGGQASLSAGSERLGGWVFLAPWLWGRLGRQRDWVLTALPICLALSLFRVCETGLGVVREETWIL